MVECAVRWPDLWLCVPKALAVWDTSCPGRKFKHFWNLHNLVLDSSRATSIIEREKEAARVPKKVKSRRHLVGHTRALLLQLFNVQLSDGGKFYAVWNWNLRRTWGRARGQVAPINFKKENKLRAHCLIVWSSNFGAARKRARVPKNALSVAPAVKSSAFQFCVFYEPKAKTALRLVNWNLRSSSKSIKKYRTKMLDWFWDISKIQVSRSWNANFLTILALKIPSIFESRIIWYWVFLLV